MNAKILEKYRSVLQNLAKFKQEEDIIDECLNKSMKQNNVQVYIAPITEVNII